MIMKIAITTIALLLFCLVCPAAAADSKPAKEQLYALLTQANEAFRQANSTADDAQRQKLYEKAILSFEKIVSDGQIKNAALYYNLANAYLLKADIGRAILNYRRAEMLDAGDINIKKNLDFARTRRTDRIATTTQKRALKTLFFWHYDFSARTRFLLTCIFFALLCISLTLTIWLGRKAPLSVTAIISLVLTLSLLTSLVVDANVAATSLGGIITANEVVARQGDAQMYPPSFKDPLHAGTEFHLIKQHPGWYHIRLLDGSEGWIPQTTAELI